MGEHIEKMEGGRAHTIVGPRHLRNEHNIENNAKCGTQTKNKLLELKWKTKIKGNGIILGDKMIMGEKKMSRRILEPQYI